MNSRYTKEQVYLHNTREDIWIIVDDEVCDITDFITQHPGGEKILLKYAGKDATAAFNRVNHSSYAKQIVRDHSIGALMKDGHTSGDSDDNGQGEDDNERLMAGDPEGDHFPQEQRAYAANWHKERREKIMQDHPEIIDLFNGDNYQVLFVGIAASVVHAMMLSYSHDLPYWMIFAAAYFIGAFCKMYQFGVAHEICHNSVSPTCNDPKIKDILMRIVSLPAPNVTNYEYYSRHHLSHHQSLGSQTVVEAVQTFMKQEAFDGDLLASSMLFFSLKLTTTTKPKPLVLNLGPTYNTKFYKLVKNVIFIFMHFFMMVYWEGVLGLAYFPILTFVMFASEETKNLHGKRNFGNRQGIEKVFQTVTSVGLQSWLNLLTFIFIWYTAGPRSYTSFFKCLLYLVFSDLFSNGLLFHPLAGYFLSVHKSDSDENTKEYRCQPTHSIYNSFASIVSYNLNYHVEHHDFPNVSCSKLPLIRKIAPEYYSNLVSYDSYFSVIRDYLNHQGDDWVYSCQD